jgi:transcriptional regulator with XRE-family HTH domain
LLLRYELAESLRKWMTRERLTQAQAAKRLGVVQQIEIGVREQLRYADWLEVAIADKEWELIRRATQQGRVVGSDACQEEISSQVSQRLDGETRGSPKGAERPSEIALLPPFLS